MKQRPRMLTMRVFVAAALGLATWPVARAESLFGAESPAVMQGPEQPPPPPPPPPRLPIRDNVPAQASVRAVGTASIEGIVTSNETTPRPLRRVVMTLRDVDRAVSRTATTDDDGRFVFDRLAAGRFTLTATKATYVTAGFSARRLGAPPLPIAVSDGERLRNINLSLTRGAVVTGRVVDDQGLPVPGVRVSAAERVDAGGVITFRSAPASGGVADDRGVYRLWGLPPGTYVVAASMLGSLRTDPPRATTADEVRWAVSGTAPVAGRSGAAPPPSAKPRRPVPTFYPSVTDPSRAMPLTLAAGEERAGLDIVSQQVASATISGRVTRSDGQPFSGAIVVPVSGAPSLSNLGIVEFPPRATVRPSGEFAMAGVAPGRYTLMARASSSTPAPTPAPANGSGGSPATRSLNDLWAMAVLVVAGDDLADVRLELAPGMTVSGRFVFEGETPPPTVSSGRIAVGLVAPPNSAPALGVGEARINGDGSFAWNDVAPGSFLVRATASATSSSGGLPAVPTWMVKSAMAGGRDHLDSPLEIAPGANIDDLVVTFTDKVTQITGRVTDQTGRPAPTYSVIVFSTDPKTWQQNSRWLKAPTRPASDGRFLVAGLPPGEYYLAVITDAQPNDWYSPGYLQQVLPGAIRITLAEGEKKVQDVQLGTQ